MTEEKKQNWKLVYAIVLGFLVLQIIIYSLISNYFL